MDAANDESNDEDEDGFIMVTPIATLSQKIATESVGIHVSFTCSMLNMLGDRLRNVPKNCQLR
jgi:hypothetical protein